MARSYTKKERYIWLRGFFAGLRRSPVVKKTRKKKSSKRSFLLEKIKAYRDKNWGALYHNGKYYDTNFINSPVEISKQELKDLRSEYDFTNSKTDKEVADSFVFRSRRKYGTFDDNGNLISMPSD